MLSEACTGSGTSWRVFLCAVLRCSDSGATGIVLSLRTRVSCHYQARSPMHTYRIATMLTSFPGRSSYLQVYQGRRPSPGPRPRAALQARHRTSPPVLPHPPHPTFTHPPTRPSVPSSTPSLAHSTSSNYSLYPALCLSTPAPHQYPLTPPPENRLRHLHPLLRDDHASP